MSEFVITKEWIEANASSAGGWSKRQLKAIGVYWPPATGWKLRSIGKRITEANKAIFEEKKK